MKKLILSILINLTLLLPFRVSARDFTYTYEGQTLTYTVISERAKTCMTKASYSTAGNNVSGSLILPSNPKDGDVEYTLLKIGECAFYNCSWLTMVEIPNSVISIGERAFEDCNSLTSVIIGNNVQTIGKCAFEDCNSLTSVTIPNSVTSIGNSAFVRCTHLTSVEIPNSVTSIGDETFYDCSSLTTVVIGNAVKTIGNNAFYNCSGLTTVVIGNSVQTIGGNAFYNCSGLKGELIIPNSVISIGASAFQECGRLTSLVIGNSVQTIDDCAFMDCSGLKGQLIIPNSVTSIGDEAFYNCSGLNGELIIPNSVTSIGYAAFAYCSSLISVIIPPSVTDIGNYAFAYCSGLIKSTYPNKFKNLFEDGAWFSYPAEGAIIEDGFVYGPDKSAIYFAPLSLEGDYTIPETVETIGLAAFYACIGLTGELRIPNSVTSIGNNAFATCIGLTSVVIPPSVTSMGENPFIYCSGLIKSAYPDAIDNPFGWTGFIFSYPAEGAIIEDGFVYGPDKTSIYFAPLSLEGDYTIPETVETIGYAAFYDCIGLTGELIIPNSVTSIGKSAFQNCSGLTSVEIPNSVTSIGEYAFYDCNSIKSVKALGLKAASMPPYAFSYSTYENSPLYIPDNTILDYLENNWGRFSNIITGGIATKEFSDNVFKYRLIENPDNREAILIPGDYSSMTEANIPERFTDESGEEPVRYYVTAIGPNAFRDCSNLQTVNINSRSRINTIGENAFHSCRALKSISIPESVTNIDSLAFFNCNSLQYAEFASIEALCKIEFGNEYANPLCKAHHLYIDGEEVTEVVIPDGIETLKYTFAGANALKSVIIPTSVNTIGKLAFSKCSGMASIEIPSSVTTIGDHAFVGCSGLTSIEIPNSVTTLSEYAFNGCTGLRSLSIGNSVSAIGDHAFDGCTAMTSLVFPNSVTSIGNYAFNGCTSLWSLTIGNSVTTIGNCAFDGCKRLTSVVFPNSVTSIGNYAFSDCSGLTSVIFPNTVIPVTTIGSGAFKGCSRISSLEFGSSVTFIGSGAFRDCSDLTSIVIPASVDSIGMNAFWGCKKLTSLSFLSSPKPIELGENAFSYYEEVDKVTVNYIIPTRLFIDRAFNKRYFRGSRITSLTTGDMLSEIGATEFKGCHKLEIINIGSGLTAIGDNAFEDCEKLMTINFGCGLKTIGNAAFRNCTSLARVTISPAVETIGTSAFAGNSKLSTITMGYQMKSIGEKAFDGAPANDVRITAQLPPTAPNTTFSSYTGKLWLQDPGDNSVKDAYYDAYTCWDRFDSYALIVPEKFGCDITSYAGKPGDTFLLEPKFTPENTTLQKVFWHSTNPDIATVDAAGVVTLHDGKGSDGVEDCLIIGETLYADVPAIEIAVSNTGGGGATGPGTGNDDPNTSGINEIDYQADYEVYNLNGVKVGDSLEGLVHGFYIVRQGTTAKKIAIK